MFSKGFSKRIVRALYGGFRGGRHGHYVSGYGCHRDS